jgi:protein transport protein SEC13
VSWGFRPKLLFELLATDDGTWDASLFTAHATGVNAISWAPAIVPGALLKANTPTTGSAPAAASNLVKKFATGGCDATVKVWAWKDDSKTWIEETTLEGHTDWVRDVSWQPNIGLPKSYLATASQVRSGRP